MSHNFRSLQPNLSTLTWCSELSFSHLCWLPQALNAASVVRAEKWPLSMLFSPSLDSRALRVVIWKRREKMVRFQSITAPSCLNSLVFANATLRLHPLQSVHLHPLQSVHLHPLQSVHLQVLEAWLLVLLGVWYWFLECLLRNSTGVLTIKSLLKALVTTLLLLHVQIWRPTDSILDTLFPFFHILGKCLTDD